MTLEQNTGPVKLRALREKIEEQAAAAGLSDRTAAMRSGLVGNAMKRAVLQNPQFGEGPPDDLALTEEVVESMLVTPFKQARISERVPFTEGIGLGSWQALQNALGDLTGSSADEE